VVRGQWSVATGHWPLTTAFQPPEPAQNFDIANFRRNDTIPSN